MLRIKDATDKSYLGRPTHSTSTVDRLMAISGQPMNKFFRKACCQFTDPGGTKALLTWVGNPKQELVTGCARQPEPPPTALNARTYSMTFENIQNLLNFQGAFFLDVFLYNFNVSTVVRGINRETRTKMPL